MKTIWKYTLRPSCEFNMPKNAKVLSVQEQHGEAQLWMLVDPIEEVESRFFKCYGTGHDIPDNTGEYIGTFQVHGGSLVFHAFEVK